MLKMVLLADFGQTFLPWGENVSPTQNFDQSPQPPPGSPTPPALILNPDKAFWGSSYLCCTPPPAWLRPSGGGQQPPAGLARQHAGGGAVREGLGGRPEPHHPPFLQRHLHAAGQHGDQLPRPRPVAWHNRHRWWTVGSVRPPIHPSIHQSIHLSIRWHRPRASHFFCALYCSVVFCSNSRLVKSSANSAETRNLRKQGTGNCISLLWTPRNTCRSPYLRPVPTMANSKVDHLTPRLGRSTEMA